MLRLYKEVAGKSPSKGQLPFSTDWFMTWQPNIHASLFLNTHEYLNKAAEIDEIDIVIKAYKLYLEQIRAQGLEPQLSVTRAWRLVKFVDNGMLTMTPCSKCGGHFVTHPHEIARHYVCGMCNPPARAGKGARADPCGQRWKFTDLFGAQPSEWLRTCRMTPTGPGLLACLLLVAPIECPCGASLRQRAASSWRRRVGRRRAAVIGGQCSV